VTSRSLIGDTVTPRVGDPSDHISTTCSRGGQKAPKLMNNWTETSKNKLEGKLLPTLHGHKRKSLFTIQW